MVQRDVWLSHSVATLTSGGITEMESASLRVQQHIRAIKLDQDVILILWIAMVTSTLDVLQHHRVCGQYSVNHGHVVFDGLSSALVFNPFVAPKKRILFTVPSAANVSMPEPRWKYGVGIKSRDASDVRLIETPMCVIRTRE